MGILQRLFLGKNADSQKTVNLTNIEGWSSYDSVIPEKELINQYYGATARAVKIKADTIASYVPSLYKGDKRIEDTPLQRDLEHFNKYQTLTEARKLTQIYKSLTGVAFWIMFKSENPKYNVEFYVIDPNRVYFNTVDSMGFPTSYKYIDREGKELVIPEEFIITFRNPSPSSMFKGHSDVQASRYAHNTYEFAMNFNMNYFGNLARPELIIGLPDAGADNVKRFEAAFLSKFRGSKKSGKTAFVNHDIKVHELTRSMVDMQFTEGIKLMREEIYSAHGVPKELVLSSGTYQNVKEAQRIFQQYTIQPELDAEEDVYNEQLMPKYYGYNEIAYANQSWKAHDAVESDYKLNAETADLMASTEQKSPGTITKNEIRAVLGLAPIKGGDELAKPKEVAKEAIKIDIKQAKKIKNKDFVKYIDTKRDEYEIRLSSAFSKFFKSQNKALQKQLKAMDKPNLDYEFDQINEAQKLSKLISPIVKDISSDFIADTKKYLKIKEDQALSIEQVAYLEQVIIDLGLYVNTTTGQAILDAFARAIENNVSTKDLAKEIQDIFETYNGAGSFEGDIDRALMIARTEITGMTGWLLDDIYNNDDSISGGEWMSARDGATRPAHRDADGQIVAKGEKFLVDGEYLRFPGDPNGSAENIINCRCVKAPVV